MEGKKTLIATLFFLFLVMFAAIMILIASHEHVREDAELLSRADYLIARSEASLTRWNHGNVLH